MLARSLPEGMAALPSDLAGALLLPGSPGYEEARKPSDPRHHDYRPAALAYCRTSADVSAVVRWAARFGLRVTPRSGGHCFAGRSSAGDVVIDVSEMRAITLTGGRVEVESGVRLGELYRSLAAGRLTLPAGCGPSVGVAGLTLGGGLGLLGRRYGLTCDRLSAADVVLADGRIVHCDQRRHPDLFWALRGAGGGHFGIVTRFVFDLVPEPEVTVFELTWSPDDVADLVGAWMDWAPAAEDRLTAHLELSVPGDHDQPPIVRLVGTMIADPGPTRTAVTELGARARAVALEVNYTQLRYGDAKALLGGIPEGELDSPEPEARPPEPPRPLEFHRSEFFDAPLPRSGVAALLDQLLQSRRPGQAREVNLIPMGGAYNRVPAAATAFAHRDHSFLLEHIASVSPQAPAADRHAAADWTGRSWRTVHPWAAGGVYPNFPDLEVTDWAPAYWGSNHARLQQVKFRYDPGNLFWARQGLHVDQEEDHVRG
jgi:FAD/FMN-containing dehydrogenase